MRLSRFVRAYGYGASMVLMMGVAYGVDYGWWDKGAILPCVIALVVVNLVAKAEGDGWSVRRG